MKIDLAAGPPPDIFRHRGRHLAVSLFLLLLVLCGGLLMVYTVLSDTPYSRSLENAALALFVGPALLFTYFGTKLRGYKKLSPEEKIKLAELGRKYPEIAAYCAMVAGQDREMTYGEYEACRDREEESEPHG
jgi:hypothetical protein